MLCIAFRRAELLLQGLLPLLAALTLIALLACDSSSSPTQTTPTDSPPSPTESLRSDDFGPLAVIDSLGGTEWQSTGPEGQPAEDHTSSPVIQSSEDALAQDMALVAEAMGWTIEEAAADRRAADVVGRIAVQVAAERPEIFVGSVLSPEPGGAPMLYIKGSADEFVRKLVADAEIDVRIVDNQPYSFDELEERASQVARALQAQGFQDVSAGFSIDGAGQIKAAVAREPGLPGDAAEILSGLPAALRASVTLTVSDAPVLVEFNAFGVTNQ